MSMTIRQARLADAPRLAQWAKAMAWETEHKLLADEDIFPGVRRAIEQAGLARYFIAELDGRCAGCLMLTYEWSDWRNGDWWWFQSVYVTPAARRCGVFRTLYAEVERRARVAGAIGLRLYVERDNARAQQTYASLGMQEEPYRMLRCGFVEFS